MMGGICGGCRGARPTMNRRAETMMGGNMWRVWGARPAMKRRAETMMGGIYGGCGGLDQQ